MHLFPQECNSQQSRLRRRVAFAVRAGSAGVACRLRKKRGTEDPCNCSHWTSSKLNENMNNIVYIVGAVVIIVVVLKVLGLF